jgi:hypothetical protein
MLTFSLSDSRILPSSSFQTSTRRATLLSVSLTRCPHEPVVSSRREEEGDERRERRLKKESPTVSSKRGHSGGKDS